MSKLHPEKRRVNAVQTIKRIAEDVVKEKLESETNFVSYSGTSSAQNISTGQGEDELNITGGTYVDVTESPDMTFDVDLDLESAGTPGTNKYLKYISANVYQWFVPEHNALVNLDSGTRPTGGHTYVSRRYTSSSAPSNANGTPDYLEGDIWIDTNTDSAYVCVDSTAGSAVWSLIPTPLWQRVSGILKPVTSTDNLQSGGFFEIVNGLSTTTTANSGFYRFEAANKRLFGITSSSEKAELDIQHRQDYQLTRMSGIDDDTNLILVCTYSILASDANASASGENFYMTHPTSVNLPFNAYDIDEFTRINMAYYRTITQEEDVWEYGCDAEVWKAFKKRGKTATLIARMRYSVISEYALDDVVLYIAEEGTGTGVQTQSCTLTTSWAEYTLTADLSSLGDSLRWGIKFFAKTLPTKSIFANGFYVDVDYVELTQYAI